MLFDVVKANNQALKTKGVSWVRSCGSRMASAPPPQCRVEKLCIDKERKLYGQWAQAEGVADNAPVVYYLHGGGYFMGDLVTITAPMAHWSFDLRMRVFAIEYRLAPEHSAPAQLDDALDGYRFCLQQDRVNPRDVVFLGDSTGGHLLLTLLLKLRALSSSDLPPPRCCVLSSPLVDFREHFSEDDPRIENDLLVPGLPSREWFLGCETEELPSRTSDPFVSPILGDWSHAPPMIITSGSVELLHDQICSFVAVVKEHGITVKHVVGHEMFHNFLFFIHTGQVPAADSAMDTVQLWLCDQLDIDPNVLYEDSDALPI